MAKRKMPAFERLAERQVEPRPNPTATASPGAATYERPSREVKQRAGSGVLELDKTRLKTKRSIVLIESACFKSPKTRLKLRTDETARPYTGE
jgi:hypothetical protein